MKIRYVAPIDRNLASHRYRALIPGQVLANRGHEISVGMPDEGCINVYSKHFHQEENLEWMSKTGGVFDVCDDHFKHPELARYYINMCYLADVVTCNTSLMADIIKEETKEDAVVIPDPYEFAEAEPQFWDLSMGLWFGHQVNLKDLKDIELDCDMEVVSAFDKPRKDGPARMTPWSMEAMRIAFNRNEFAIFPAGSRDRKHAAKSKNRIVNALRAGLLCFAHPVGDFEGLEDYIIITDDLLASIRQARVMLKEDPTLFHRMITDGQEFIRERYSPDAVTDKWEGVFNEA